MAHFVAAAASVGVVVVSLSGCGTGGTNTQAPPTNGTTSTADPIVSTTTTTTDGRTPLYLVMRMDDVNPIDHADNQTDVMNWFADHNLKYNFGIIVGNRPGALYPIYWPTTCAQTPTDTFCDSPIVQRVNKAYSDGEVVGTRENAIFEIGSHGFDHEGWGEKWTGFVPASDWADYQDRDLNLSASTLKRIYPNASIKYFAAPTNMASADTLASLKRHGLEILSAAATEACGTYAQPPYYLTPPCGVEDATQTITPTCMPEGDVWATTDGFARIQGVVSAPAGSANTNWAGGGQQGISVSATIGVEDCGCRTETTGGNTKVLCSVVSSAKNNAAKSNGLHWSVLMMHPSSVFPDGQSYPEWLDEFYERLQALEDYNVHFINFQDLAQIHAQGLPGKVEFV